MLKQQLKIIFSGALFIIAALFFENLLSIPIAKWGELIEGFIVLSISALFYLISLGFVESYNKGGGRLR